jgi:hypothetical protein
MFDSYHREAMWVRSWSDVDGIEKPSHLRKKTMITAFFILTLHRYRAQNVFWHNWKLSASQGWIVMLITQVGPRVICPIRISEGEFSRSIV